eukprot:SM000236S08004  [mRNA]  locus=s236:122801:127604:+ [translate_table: standard]
MPQRGLQKCAAAAWAERILSRAMHGGHVPGDASGGGGLGGGGNGGGGGGGDGDCVGVETRTRTVLAAAEAAEEPVEASSLPLRDGGSSVAAWLGKVRDGALRELRERSEHLEAERELWGPGLGAVFVIRLDRDGAVQQVTVDTEEVQVRSGILPQLAAHATQEELARAADMEARALAYAEDIRTGKVNPPRWSSVCKFVTDAPEASVGFSKPLRAAWRAARGMHPSAKLLGLAVASYVAVGVVLALPIISAEEKRRQRARREAEDEVLRMRKLKALASRRKQHLAPATIATGEDAGEELEELSDGDDDDYGPVRQRPVPALTSADGSRVVPTALQGRGSMAAPAAATTDGRDAAFLQKAARIRAVAAEARAREDAAAAARRSQEEEQDQAFLRQLEERQPAEAALDEAASAEVDDAAEQPPREGYDEDARQARREHRDRQRAVARWQKQQEARLASSPQLGHSAVQSLDAGDSREQAGRADNLRQEAGAESGAARSSFVPDASTRQRRRPRIIKALDVEQNSARQPGSSTTPSVNSRSDQHSGRRVINSERSADTEAQRRRGEAAGRSSAEEDEGATKIEKESVEKQDWMEDDELREIVFAVRDNEAAGQPPFDGLSAAAERRFFAGLEAKYAGVGERVRDLANSHVANLDYGRAGVALNDSPQEYRPRLREVSGEHAASSEAFSGQFRKHRESIIDRYKETNRKANGSSDAGHSQSEARSAKVDQCQSQDVGPASTLPGQEEANDTVQESSRSSLARGHEGVTSSTGPHTVASSLGSRPAWEHTRRWAAGLQQKYDQEIDPQVKSLMEEVGKDLKRWVTEEEVEAFGKVLDRGEEATHRYIDEAFAIGKAKLQEQEARFGRDVMVEKYHEYKIDEVEDARWWLRLPFVVCIALQMESNGERRDGLYSLDMAPLTAIDDRDSPARLHVVAFEDRREAERFRNLLSISDEHHEDFPELQLHKPQELLDEANDEGHEVTVLRQGQLALAPGQLIEDVESRIIAIGGARYVDEALRNRAIDLNAAIDQGLGFTSDVQAARAKAAMSEQ